MNPRDLKKFQTFIDKNLQRGFIQPANSHIAPVLFQEKKDVSLDLYVDYCGLNAICLPPAINEGHACPLGKREFFFYKIRPTGSLLQSAH